ncbi:hypothetical protein D3C79_693720 [compost metagenome]
MGVFFGFRDAQLGFVVLHQPLTEGVGQRGWWIGTGGFDVGGVFGQHDKITKLDHFATWEAVEIGIDEGAGDLARTVGTEVHED